MVLDEHSHLPWVRGAAPQRSRVTLWGVVWGFWVTWDVKKNNYIWDFSKVRFEKWWKDQTPESHRPRAVCRIWHLQPRGLVHGLSLCFSFVQSSCNDQIIWKELKTLGGPEKAFTNVLLSEWMKKMKAERKEGRKGTVPGYLSPNCIEDTRNELYSVTCTFRIGYIIGGPSTKWKCGAPG